MASVAGIRGVGVIARFTRCSSTIVATHTSTNHLRMVQRRNDGRPIGRRDVMAKFAIVGGIRVIPWFTRCSDSIVATSTATDHLRMIQRRKIR